MITTTQVALYKVFSDICNTSIYVYEEDSGWMISTLSGEWWSGRGQWTDREEKSHIYSSKEEAVIMAEQILETWEAQELKRQDELEYEKFLREKENT